ncbi:replication initiator protein A [Neisseria sp. Ec49-e6-T10]|uniref:replication initiator protein A n=1 Tax=Neisseria sp. Ec49-e6-T10 TaxID=3140744 RepID=UPI003EBD5EAA
MIKNAPSLMYRQSHFYTVDINNALPKNLLNSTHSIPVFALQLTQTKVRQNVHQHNINIKIESKKHACVGIYDMDIWNYAITLLYNQIKSKSFHLTNPAIQFSAHSFLIATNRRTSGNCYQQLFESLQRLNDNQITIHIPSKEYTTTICLIDSWRKIKNEKNQMIAIEVVFPDWLFNAILAKRIVAIHQDYFFLRKPLERRLYLIACKRCAHQARHSVSLRDLYTITGSIASLREFRRSIKTVVKQNNLPDYQIRYYQDNDSVCFYNRVGIRGYKTQIRDLIFALNETRKKDYVIMTKEHI